MVESKETMLIRRKMEKLDRLRELLLINALKEMVEGKKQSAQI